MHLMHFCGSLASLEGVVERQVICVLSVDRGLRRRYVHYSSVEAAQGPEGRGTQSSFTRPCEGLLCGASGSSGLRMRVCGMLENSMERSGRACFGPKAPVEKRLRDHDQ